MSADDTLTLPAEEAWLWECARSWPGVPAPVDPARLDWARIVDLGVRNRMQVRIERVLTEAGIREALPRGPSDALAAAVEKHASGASDVTALLRRYLPEAWKRGVQTAVIKGLHLCQHVYQDAWMRPGSDVDLLVRRGQVQDSVDILESLGLGRFWPPLLEDPYYDRHHLHQQRCTPERLWVDVHWALDHPYNCLTIDYESLMGRSTPGTLVGAPVCRLTPVDDLLCLVVHLVKHAVYLPGVLRRPDLQRIILADGFLVYFLDVVALLQRDAARIDWAVLTDRAREWGATASLHASLHVCRDWLAAPVPADVLERMRPAPPGGLTRWCMSELAERKLGELDGRRPGVVARYLFGHNDTLLLRPVRLLDLASFIVPSREYLRRRYGSSSLPRLVRHVTGAVLAACRFVLDTAYYTAKRQVRPNPRAPALHDPPARGTATT